MDRQPIFAILLWVGAVTAQARHHGSLQPPARSPLLGEITSQGCFLEMGPVLAAQTVSVFMSVGLCANNCRRVDATVAVLRGSQCWCANLYPPLATRVADSECSLRCPGYAYDICGGRNAYSVYNIGRELEVEYHDDTGTNSVMSSDTAWTKVAETAYDYSTVLGGVSKSVQDFFNSCLGRTRSPGGGKQAKTRLDGTWDKTGLSLGSDVKNYVCM
ncbi:hypothetical protein B0I35DRAFT_425129 [Stachybotrys elegans]|uniref:WSC domain-containing protein n=1 Tax=Stachybotrys elegans TaxID=80388 RepID=A0A8K0SWC2_9HYPO|nr:hypothetical protein B0I35DRAFT_425129 [Stachybotrys elegans]